jgi:hypothetical protein
MAEIYSAMFLFLLSFVTRNLISQEVINKLRKTSNFLQIKIKHTVRQMIKKILLILTFINLLPKIKH